MDTPELNEQGHLADIPLSSEAKITVERRGEIVLIGVNWPQNYNRFDPDAFFGRKAGAEGRRPVYHGQ